jgi:serine/threonine protein kinase
MDSDTAQGSTSPFDSPIADQRRRVDRLVEAALDLPHDARKAFIEESCATDPQLESAAKRLLASCERLHEAGDFLSGTALEMAGPMLDDLSVRMAETEPMAPALASALSEQYAVSRKIGRGATATVFLATDVARRCDVAIKVLRPELAESTAATRFLREVHLMSQLDHPRIAPVLDAGERASSLYYVLPYMDGGSLRDRLATEKQLPIDEAVGIAVTMADALHYAHRHGLIHRDVKPENILFSGGQPYLADFGIARALEHAQGEASTTTGLVRGTVPYMSPEQATGNRDIDGRSDLYSLGCVLYEMLAGIQAFVAPSPEGILAQKLTHPPRGVRVYRPTVGPKLESVVMRALQISPADRYRDAGELAQALRQLSAEERTVSNNALADVGGRSVRRRSTAIAAVAAAAVAMVVLLARYGPPPFRGASIASRPDTTIVALLPLERSGGSARSLDDDQLLHEAISWWRGLVLVDRFLVGDATRRRRPTMSSQDASDLAASVGAGRFVRGTVSLQGETWRVYAALYDVGRSTALQQASETVPDDLAGATAAYARVARTLLLRGAGEDSTAGVASTNSLPAAQAMARAQGALDVWDLVAADSAFQAAVQLDPDYARASFLLAQVRAWRGLPRASWSSLADRAAANTARLSWKEGQLATALTMLARARYEDACRIYDQVRRRNDREFSAWYGLGMCRTMDRGVIPDSASPSGWRFRSSYQRAVAAYTTAFEILPSVHRGYERGAFEEVMRILLVVGTTVVTGRGVDADSAVYQARPIWIEDGDTLALIPYPWEIVAVGAPNTTPPGFAQALDHQRKQFATIAARWSSAYPASAGAKQAECPSSCWATRERSTRCGSRAGWPVTASAGYSSERGRSCCASSSAVHPTQRSSESHAHSPIHC